MRESPEGQREALVHSHPSLLDGRSYHLYAPFATALLHSHVLSSEQEHGALARVQSGCCDTQAERLESPRAQRKSRKQSLAS